MPHIGAAGTAVVPVTLPARHSSGRLLPIVGITRADLFEVSRCHAVKTCSCIGLTMAFVVFLGDGR